MKKIVVIAVLMMCGAATVYAQAWRDCVPGSIGPGGCD